jgi:hypothetical protein
MGREPNTKTDLIAEENYCPFAVITIVKANIFAALKWGNK